MEKRLLIDIVDDILSDDKRLFGFYLEHITDTKRKLHVAIKDKNLNKYGMITYLQEFGINTNDVELVICSVDDVIDVYVRNRGNTKDLIKLTEANLKTAKTVKKIKKK